MVLIEVNEANENEHKRPELTEAKPFVEDETSFTKTPQSFGVDMEFREG